MEEQSKGAEFSRGHGRVPVQGDTKNCGDELPDDNGLLAPRRSAPVAGQAALPTLIPLQRLSELSLAPSVGESCSISVAADGRLRCINGAIVSPE